MQWIAAPGRQARPRALGVATSKGLSTYPRHMSCSDRLQPREHLQAFSAPNVQKLRLEVTISHGPCHCQGHRGSTHGTEPGSLPGKSSTHRNSTDNNGSLLLPAHPGGSRGVLWVKRTNRAGSCCLSGNQFPHSFTASLSHHAELVMFGNLIGNTGFPHLHLRLLGNG